MMGDRILYRSTYRHIVHHREIYLVKTHVSLSTYKLDDSLVYVYLFLDNANVSCVYIGRLECVYIYVHLLREDEKESNMFLKTGINMF